MDLDMETELGETEFQKVAQTIATSIQKILQNVSTMQRMVNQINTPQDSPDLKRQLHQIMTYTHQLVSDTNSLLKEINKCKARHLKIQRDRLVDEFTTALNLFQKVQQKTVNIEKSMISQARENSYIGNKSPGFNNASQSNKLFFEDNFTTSRGSQQKQMQEEIDLQALEEQERTIRELEENIVGVNEIYKKLGAMVYEQGAVVDSIESNVEQTNIFVSSGSENLRKAASLKNKLRKRKLILVSILLAVLLIIIIIVTWRYN